MGRKRKFPTGAALEAAWAEYKKFCNNLTVPAHNFSAKNSEFVTAELKKQTTYTIEGFCVWAGIARQSFYEYYANHANYADIVTRMHEECEVDARIKFETGVIPTQLAGLWMSKYGYSMKTDNAVSGNASVVISGGDALED